MSFSLDSAQQLRASLPAHATENSHENSLALLTQYRSFYKLDRFTATPFIWRIDYTPAKKDKNQKTFELVIQAWLSSPTAPTLFIVHGFLDHTGLYGRAIEWGLAQKYNVVIFDLPGHGLSSGQQAYIESFDHYSEALLAVVDNCLNEPKLGLNTLESNCFYSLSQSTGSAVVTNTQLFFRPDVFKHSIMLAPLVRSHGWARLRWLYFILKIFKKNTLRDYSVCSHDNEFLHFVKNKDALQAKNIPTQWLAAMDQWNTKIRRAASKTTSNQSVTIIQGNEDTTVDWRYNNPLLQTLFPTNQLFIIDGAYHHLLNESEHYWQQIVPVMKQALHSGEQDATGPFIGEQP